MDGSTNPQAARTEIGELTDREILLSQNAMLRLLTEQMAALLKALTPAPKEGPSLNEMLATVIELLEQQGGALTRVEGHTVALGTALPPLIAREIARMERNRDLNA